MSTTTPNIASRSTPSNHADTLTRAVTAFRTFDELCAPGYTPTLIGSDRETRALRELYDLTMWARGDERRAYAGRGAR